MIKLFLIFGIALAATTLAAEEAEKRSHIKTKWIQQKVDHFNSNDNRTWKMRYMVNPEFYVPGGPLFISVGGIGSLSQNSISITEGLFYDTAREHRALLFQTEHRFYGESRPTKDMSVENLKYLSAQQALADLAHFIRTIKTYPIMKNSRVILAGELYAGALVVWFKQSYPKLAVGGWASSPPLLAKLDFKECKEATGQSIRLVGGDSCYNRIANGVKEMEQLLAENRTAELKSALNLCETFDANNELDVASLFSYVFDAFKTHVDLHNIGNQYINNVCKDLMAGPDDFKSLSNFFVDYYDNSTCNNFSYNDDVAAAKVTTFENTPERPWFYQVCNEFGWFTSTTSTQQPFGTKLPIKFYHFTCKYVFGDKFTPEYMESQINKTNNLYGGLNSHVKNVFITYGQLDPWLKLGIQDVTRATIIPMESNTPDLNSISDEDSKQLKDAKMKFKQYVKYWIKSTKKQY